MLNQQAEYHSPDHRREQGSSAIVELKGVEKRYSGEAGDCLALARIDLSIARGEYLALLGKSGSGKSTLINMITGIDRPTSGEIYVSGAAVHTLSEHQAAVWRGHNVGIVFQFFQLIPTLTAIENIMLPMDFCNTFPGRRNERAMSLLDRVGMDRYADRLPTALSGGERQRVAIARALANDPPLVVADEPTGNLDSRTSDSICSLFEDLRADGKTLVVVSHDGNISRRSSRSVTIADGQIVKDQ